MKCISHIPALKRVLLSLSILCFFLPFISVKSCNSTAMTNYSGLKLLQHSGGWIYAVLIGLSVCMLIMSFLRRKIFPPLTGVVSAGASVISALGFVIVIFYPELQFLFDEVFPRVGQVTGGFCWALLYILNCMLTVTAINSIRKNYASSGNIPVVNRIWRIIFVISAVIVILLPYVGLIHEPGAAKCIVSAVVMLFFSSPLIAMLYCLQVAVGEGRRWGRISSGLLFALLVVFAIAGPYAVLKN